MRNLGLDLLRLLAIVLVLGRHFHFPETQIPSGLYLWFQGGWVGVDLFFVLSGFLVSGLLFHEYLRHGSIQVKRFLIRRGLKIYPAFWVLLGTTLIWRLVTRETMPPRYVLGELIFMQNYLGGLWNYTWSLAVEEHFYIGIALLFVFLLRRRPAAPFDSIPRIFWFLVVACLVFRTLTVLHIPDYQGKWYTFATHNRIDALFFGVLLSYLWHFKGLKERSQFIPSIVLVMGGICLLAPAFAWRLEDYKWMSAAGVMLFSLGAGCLLLAALRLPRHDSRLLNLGGTLGGASYSIYLWHGPVNEVCKALFHQFSGYPYYLSYVPVYFVSSLAFGLLMSKLVEWPVLRIRDRVFPSEKALS